MASYLVNVVTMLSMSSVSVLIIAIMTPVDLVNKLITSGGSQSVQSKLIWWARGACGDEHDTQMILANHNLIVNLTCSSFGECVPYEGREDEARVKTVILKIWKRRKQQKIRSI